MSDAKRYHVYLREMDGDTEVVLAAHYDAKCAELAHSVESESNYAELRDFAERENTALRAELARYKSGAVLPDFEPLRAEIDQHCRTNARLRAEVERLRAALAKAADTFADLQKGMTLMQHPLAAASCEIAERGCRAALAGGK